MCGGVDTALRHWCHWVLLQFAWISVGVGQCERTINLYLKSMLIIEFSLNVSKIFVKRVRTCHRLCKRPGSYHSTSETHVRDRIFKLNPIHASVIYQFPRIQWIADPFRENFIILIGIHPMSTSLLLKCEQRISPQGTFTRNTKRM